MALKLNILPPSVNNMCVRVFVRAAGLDFEEVNVFGETRSEAYLAKNPSHLTPSIEVDGLPKGLLWESCAIMAYLANRHNKTEFYPTNLETRAMIDNANFYLIGSLYPLVQKATYPRLRFQGYPGDVATSDASETAKEAARKASADAIAPVLEVFRKFFIHKDGFIAGNHPTIADMRLAATLEFLPVIDYALPSWTSDYMKRVETALGTAYTEPAADVRGYIAHLKSQ